MDDDNPSPPADGNEATSAALAAAVPVAAVPTAATAAPPTAAPPAATTTTTEATTSTSTSCVVDETGRWSGKAAKLLVLEEAKLGNVYDRAREFEALTGASISITPVSINDWQTEVFLDAGAGGGRVFDGYSLKGNWIPSLVEAGGLASMTDLVDQGDLWTDLAWTDVFPVIRDSICVNGGQIYSVPVDADYIVTAARDDLVRDAGAPLDTWEEWVSFAESQHGLDLNGDGTPDYGACLAKGEGWVHFSVFANLWTIAAPYLQRGGRMGGAFFDPVTFEPLWETDEELADGFEEAIDLYRRLVSVSPEGKQTAPAAKGLMQGGRCATYLTLPGLAFGIQDTGGIKAPNRTDASFRRFPSPGVECASAEACPDTEPTTSGRLVHRAPFFATSGTAMSIGSQASPETQQLLFELYAYMAAPSQSGTDVQLRSSFSDPFRMSHVGPEATERLVTSGWDLAAAESYHEVVRDTLNDPGAALDLRVPKAGLYQASVLQAIDPFVYAGNGTASEAACHAKKAWADIPPQAFPGSTPENARLEMRDIYRAQLGLPEILTREGGINIKALIIAVSTLGGILLLAALIAFAVWIRRTVVRKRQLEEEAALVIEQQVDDAFDVIKSFQAPLVLMRGDKFLELGNLRAHEKLRDEGQLVFVDTMEGFDASEYKKQRVTVFFSHQWCGDSDPDPDVVQYPVMCEALSEIAKKEGRPMEECFVWVDFFSIPQLNRSIQRLAIGSLPALASILQYFVAVCPTSRHAATEEICDEDSYFGRCWTRAEMMSYWSRCGSSHMFYTKGNADNKDVLCPLVPQESSRETKLDAIRAFQGQLTCCRLQHNCGTEPCDREELMLPMLGLYGEIYSKRNDNSVKHINDAIESHLEQIYPPSFEYNDGKEKVKRVLFGDLVKAVRHRIQVREGMVSPDDLELGKMTAGTSASSGTQSTIHGKRHGASSKGHGAAKAK